MNKDKEKMPMGSFLIGRTRLSFVAKPSFIAAIAVLFFLLASGDSISADTLPEVTLDAGHAGPRAIESLTERAVLRDYRFAWASLAQALGSNSTVPLNGIFAGSAGEWLREVVAGQRRTGITSHYLNQGHKLEAVFYAPEGDLIELQDTANYDFRIDDGERTIHDEHVVAHYIVIMTPGADRWVIRQLQSVQQF